MRNSVGSQLLCREGIVVGVTWSGGRSMRQLVPSLWLARKHRDLDQK